MARDIRIGMEVRGKGVERGIQRKRLRMRKGKEPYARAENRMAKKMIILWMDEQLMRCMRERIQWRDGCQQLPHLTQARA